MILKSIKLVAILLVGFSSQVGLAHNSPKGVVEQFLSLDFNGARLSSSGYIGVEKLVNTIDSEPGWDSVKVTKEYIVKSVKNISDNTTNVEVEYQFSGIFTDKKFEYEDSNSIYVFHLEYSDGQWRIQNIPPYPRVGSRELNDFLLD